MKDHDSNPILARYRHLIPADGLYAAADVAIVWSHDRATDLVNDVTVQFIPAVARRDMQSAPHTPWVAAWREYDRQWHQSGGNNTVDWADGTRARATPEGLFAIWLANGFKTKEETERAVRELARIRECGWARTMVAAWSEGTPTQYEDDDEEGT